MHNLNERGLALQLALAAARVGTILDIDESEDWAIAVWKCDGTGATCYAEIDRDQWKVRAELDAEVRDWRGSDREFLEDEVIRIAQELARELIR